jgi:hypothetical protein
MTEPTKLSHGDLQAVLHSLPSNLRGQAYLDAGAKRVQFQD